MKQKTTLIFTLAFVLLFGSAGCAGPAGKASLQEIASSSVTTKPDEIAAIAQTVADFDILSGFVADLGVKFPGFTLVSYKSQSADTHIFIIQFLSGTNLDPQAMMDQMKSALKDQNYTWFNVDMKAIEQKSITMRDQETTLTTSAGQESDGGVFYQAVTAFEGKGGPAMLVVAGPAANWDATMVEEFARSFK